LNNPPQFQSERRTVNTEGQPPSQQSLCHCRAARLGQVGYLRALQ